ncbi:hypothetical protein [Pseudodesulfovibrio sediminis]|uniref:Uncharacterized protein n=1 Tax=Pseudodesulfovibrio sediminis TaxID=2810563 RepID=A0ABM7P6Q7_9BACT|nr:hypothetical protein [Pseudodesulfovibrio sediminis]BCS88625.1 hypothetical protein PSDVSF_18670 [Pseudodesulfovibrio sediminis]
MKNNNINILSALNLMATVFLSLCVLSVLCVVPAQAEDEEVKGLMEVNLSVKPDPLAPTVEKSIDHLYAVLQKKGPAFDMAQIQDMLDFVMDTPGDPKDIEPAKRFGGKGICLRRQVSTDLERILRFFYNPEIPNFLLCPAVLAQSGWREGSEFLARDKGMWEELDNLATPIIVRGKEYEMTAPDSFAEAYYLYDLNRLMILCTYRDKRILISVTEQADKSDVGRKGAILNDQEWDYFYSGIPGLNKGMIGWMDTFTYASGSVQVYVEDLTGAPTTTVFLFKWLKAGWAGLNVVKRSHIYDGTLRYARSFAKVMESTNLTPDMVATAMKEVAQLTEADMEKLMKEYSVNFEARFKSNPKLETNDYAEIIENGDYLNVLDNKSRRSLLALEKLKSLLGMETLVSVGSAPVPVQAVTEVPVEEDVEKVVVPLETAKDAGIQSEIIPEG